MRYQHWIVTVLATRSQHNTHCVSHTKVLRRLDSTGQIADGGLFRHPFHCTFIMFVCWCWVGVLHVRMCCSSRFKSQRETRLDRVVSCCLQTPTDSHVCVCVVFLVTKTRCHMTTMVLWTVLQLFQRLLTVVIEWYSSPSSDIWIVVEIGANKVGRSRVTANLLFVSVSLANCKRFQITQWLAWTDFVLLNRAWNQYWSVQERLYCSGWNRIQHSVDQWISQDAATLS